MPIQSTQTTQTNGNITALTYLSIKATGLGAGPYYAVISYNKNSGSGDGFLNMHGWTLRIREDVPTTEAVVESNAFSFQPGYRYGFNGQERDDEVKGSGNSYDFGARIYDPRLGRFLSLDPLTSKFPAISPYLYANDNPIYFIDEDGESGKAYKTDQVNQNTGRPTLKVVSNVYIFGEGANSARRDAIANDLNSQYNNGGNYFTHTDANGTTYDVVFEFNVEVVGLGEALDGIRQTNVENNYYLVDDGQGVSYTISGDPSSPGGNTGYLSREQLDKNQGTASHEKNHGFGGEKHPLTSPVNDGSTPDISLPDGQKYSDGTTVDASNRSVSQKTIDNIFKGVKFNSEGEGNVGNPRRQVATGNENHADVSRNP